MSHNVHTKHLSAVNRIQPPPGKLTPTQAAVNAAADEGLTFVCYYDDVDDPDYVGKDPLAAWEALTACGEMLLDLRNAAGKRIGTAQVVCGNGQEDLVDYIVGDWFDRFWDANGKDFD